MKNICNSHNIIAITYFEKLIIFKVLEIVVLQKLFLDQTQCVIKYAISYIKGLPFQANSRVFTIYINLNYKKK